MNTRPFVFLLLILVVGCSREQPQSRTSTVAIPHDFPPAESLSAVLGKVILDGVPPTMPG